MNEKEFFKKHGNELRELMEVQNRITNIMFDAFKKEKNKAYALLALTSAPINFLMVLLGEAEENGLDPYELIEDLPGSFIRMYKPMEEIQHKWRKVPIKQFCEEYRQTYDKAQRDHFGLEYINANNLDD